MSGPIWDIVSPYIQRLRMSGPNNAIGLCPFHSEQSPSFSINTENGLWLCFACGLRGNLNSFLKRVGRGSTEIEEILGPLASSLKEDRERKKIRRQLRFREDPFRGDHIIPDALLGMYEYCPTGLLDAGYKKSLLKELDIGYDKNKDRIIFPIRDLYGALVGVSGRATNPDDFPRYKVYKAKDFGKRFEEAYPDYDINKSRYLWNGHRVISRLMEEDGQLIIVEGFKACLWLLNNGYENVVALMGKFLSETQADIIRRLSNPITLFLDNDLAGIEATVTIGSELSKTHRVYVAKYPGSDSAQPDDLNQEQLQQALREAQRWSQWRKIQRGTND